MKIDRFDGEYFFLSNFFPCHVELGGITYLSVEAAFQASKSKYEPVRKQFVNVSPKEAKRMGRNLKIDAAEWDSQKDFVMQAAVIKKFISNPHLAHKLIATGDAELIEGNTWGDCYWGVCNGQGLNKLGHILMDTRKVLKEIFKEEV